MIIRVFRYRLRPDAQAAFEAAVVAEGFPAIARVPSMRLALAGRAGRANASSGALVTGWDTFEAMLDSVDNHPEWPVFLQPAAQGLVTERMVSHHEALDLPSIGAGSAGVMRLLRGHVPASEEGAYFDWVRTGLWPRLASLPGLAGAWVGRHTTEDDIDHVVGISTWTSRQAVERSGGAVGPVHPGSEAIGFVVDSIEVLDLYAMVLRTQAPVEREATG